MEKRRRMMMMSRKKEPFIIFQHGNDSLTNGTLSNRYALKNGMIVISSGDVYYRDAFISGINFSGYKKLCFRVNVPDYHSYVGGGGDEIGVGYGPVGSNGNANPEKWIGGQLYTKKGEHKTELDVSSVKTVCPINLITAGISTDQITGERNYAVLQVYDIWLE